MAQDLSHLLPAQPLTGSGSMVAGNGVSDESAAMTAPGSRSEQTDITPAMPGGDIPPMMQPTVVVDGTGPGPDYGYSTPDGHGWHTLTDTDVDTGQARDEAGRWTEE
jgi:hypothetical protein